MGSGSAPEYAKTTTDMGIFGSATSDKHGATWNGTDWQNRFVSQMQNDALNNWQKAQNREVAQEAIDNYNRQFTNDFNNNYLANALKNNILRGSSASDMMAMANNNYINDRYNLTNQEMAKNLNLANNALNNYFNMSTLAQNLINNAEGHSDNVSQYQLGAYNAENQANNGLYSALGTAVGGLATGAGSLGGGYLISQKK